jgi:hypothetical protein
LAEEGQVVRSHQVGQSVQQNGTAEASVTLPAVWRRLSRGQRLWRLIKSIYYASSPSWQVLKSGALFFFGFFCWAAGNLLHAYLPNARWPFLLIVYGALLFWWGPLTHLVFVPRLIPWLRRQHRQRVLHWLGGHFTLTMLTVFFIVVVLLSLRPPSFMVLDVRGRLNRSGQGVEESVAAVPELRCTRSSSQISCTLTPLPTTVARIEFSSGTRRLLVLQVPQATFTFSERDLVEVLGTREFRVSLYDAQGRSLREFVRTTAFL